MKARIAIWIKALLLFAAVDWAGHAAAQSFPRAKPVPPRGPRVSVAALAAPNAVLAQAPQLSPWQPLANQPPFPINACNTGVPGAGNPLLLTDGTVIVQDAGCQDWLRLTPDSTGSYVHGTWSQIASLPPGYAPLYHSSAVLADGRVIIEGGEYNFFNPVWTNLGAIYDPKADTWRAVDPPNGWSSIGDAQGVVLFDGRFMQANCCTTQSALLDPATLSWTPTGAGKYDPNDEEGWTLLPNQRVLAVDAYVPISPFPYIATGTNSELYTPSSGTWHRADRTQVQLWDSAANCGQLAVATFELGPAILRPDGSVFYTGANSCGAGHTAIYNSQESEWHAGPDFPDGLDIADGPAALETNGKVLMMASPGAFNTPSTFLEWDGKALNIVPGPPNASTDSSYYGNMLVLPTGQILLTDFSTDIEIYTPGGTPNPAWAPTISQAPGSVTAGGSYAISGILFNGMSQAAAYGDDVQAATNFPIVRIKNKATGHVFYSRTHDHSSMAVASRNTVSTQFDVPRNQEKGPSEIVVVANGIPSAPLDIYVRPRDE